MRPFCSKRAIHATFRASRARREWSLRDFSHKGPVYALGIEAAERARVKLIYIVNVGNHIHVVVKAKKRVQLQRFLKSFSGQVAMLVTGARKGRPLEKRFWDYSVFTKIVSFGRQWANLKKYMAKNLREAEGEGVLLRISGMPDVWSTAPPGT